MRHISLETLRDMRKNLARRLSQLSGFNPADADKLAEVWDIMFRLDAVETRIRAIQPERLYV